MLHIVLGILLIAGLIVAIIFNFTKTKEEKRIETMVEQGQKIEESMYVCIKDRLDWEWEQFDKKMQNL